MRCRIERTEGRKVQDEAHEMTRCTAEKAESTRCIAELRLFKTVEIKISYSMKQRLKRTLHRIYRHFSNSFCCNSQSTKLAKESKIPSTAFVALFSSPALYFPVRTVSGKSPADRRAQVQ